SLANPPPLHDALPICPTLIGLHECERVTLSDLKLRSSPAWTVHPALCQDVSISNIRISNPADSPNTDGIDPESCRNVRISNCHRSEEHTSELQSRFDL